LDYDHTIDLPYVALVAQVPSPDPLFGQATSVNRFAEEAYATLGQFLPSLIWAIILLVLGWVVATVVALPLKACSTKLTWMIAWPVGHWGSRQTRICRWSNGSASIVYWVIFIFAIVAALNALELDAVSSP
jgi:hypothetical protein